MHPILEKLVSIDAHEYNSKNKSNMPKNITKLSQDEASPKDVPTSVNESGLKANLEPLPPDLQKELDEIEVTLKSGWDTFVAVGSGLATVNRKRLYRAKYLTFEAYCLGELGFSRAYSYNLIGSSEVKSQLSSIEDIAVKPANEAQCRELIHVPKEKRPEAWKRALEAAGQQPLTAEIIHLAVAPYKPWTKYTSKSKKRAQTKSNGLKSALKLLAKVEEAAEKSNDQPVLAELAALRKCLAEIV